MHQSFVSTAPPRPWNSGAFNVSLFKALLKDRYLLGQICGKFLVKSPGSPEAGNNMGQQLGVVLIKNKKGLEFLHLYKNVLMKIIRIDMTMYWQKIKTPALPGLVRG